MAEASRHTVLADAPPPPGGGPLAMGEVAYVEKVVLRGDPADAAFVTAVRDGLGAAPPVEPFHVATGSDCHLLWQAWDTWLVRGPDGHTQAGPGAGAKFGGPLVGLLREALADVEHGSATDISEAETIIRLAGDEARLVLSKGCPLDLHVRAFRPGEARRSLLAGADVTLRLLDGPGQDTFDIHVRRSFAASLWRWLAQAGRAHGLGPLPPAPAGPVRGELGDS
ncbi:MAG: sarcosine oxidase subunit gamma family protein [Alphaproteobacteria bacterium]